MTVLAALARSVVRAIREASHAVQGAAREAFSRAQGSEAAPPPTDLTDGEAAARSKLAAELAHHFALVSSAFALVADVLSARGSEAFAPTQAFKVCTALLSKLSTDLRGVVLLAERGYPTQAVTVVSSLYETAFAVAYIGSDERLAQEWIDRSLSDPTQSFRSPWVLTVDGLRNLGVGDPESAAEAHYRTYSQLCMAKHAHPGFLLHHAIQKVGEDVFTVNGPNTSDMAVRAVAFALEGAVGLTYIALASFIDNHVPGKTRALLRAKATQMGAARAELREASTRRWPGGDPYPGQWRRAKGSRPPS